MSWGGAGPELGVELDLEVELAQVSSTRWLCSKQPLSGPESETPNTTLEIILMIIIVLPNLFPNTGSEASKPP